jgi:hypothetical protein
MVRVGAGEAVLLGRGGTVGSLEGAALGFEEGAALGFEEGVALGFVPAGLAPLRGVTVGAAVVITGSALATSGADAAVVPAPGWLSGLGALPDPA